jgi:hypothetical protein
MLENFVNLLGGYHSFEFGLAMFMVMIISSIIFIQQNILLRFIGVIFFIGSGILMTISVVEIAMSQNTPFVLKITAILFVAMLILIAYSTIWYWRKQNKTQQPK